MWRASESSIPKESSAAEVVLPAGALTTRMPRSVAALTSMLSMPTPARAMIFRFLPRSMTSRPTFEALRTMSPSKGSMQSRSSSCLSEGLNVTSRCACRASASSPAFESPSVQRIL